MLENLKLKGPICLGYNIQYRMFSDSNIITNISPLYYISFISYETKTIIFSLDNIRLKKDNSFIEYIKQLENTIKDKHKKKFKDKDFVSCIYEWNNNFYLKCRIENTTQCYDLDKNKIINKIISKGNVVKILIWIKGINISSTSCNLSLEVLQIRLYDVIPSNKCLIDFEEEPKNENNTTNGKYEMLDKSYDRFVKMLKMGININAVRQKCQLEGIDPTPLFKDDNSVETKKLSILPNNPMMNVLSGIGKVKLKKTEVNSLPKKPNKNKNVLVPTLDDILLMKNKLKHI